MKNIKILLATVIIAALSLTSCSKDDAPTGPVTNGSLTEKWNPTKTIVRSNGVDLPAETYSDNVATCDKNFLEFTTTTANFIVYYKNATGSCLQDASNTATYVRNGLNLVITGGKYDGTYTITTLSNSELIIKASGNVGSVPITTTTYFTKAAAN